MFVLFAGSQIHSLLLVGFNTHARLLLPSTMTNFRKLGRPTGHRMSMLRTMVSQLVKHERIETTITKAKEVRRLADNMVQLGKDTCLCLRGDDVLHKLLEVAYRFKDRAGGYTRVLRTRIRVGDAAPMAYIEDATMTPTRNALNRVLLSIKPLGTMLSSSPTKFRFFSTIDEATSATATAVAALPTQSTVPSNPRDASDVFRDWGCTEADIHRIFTRRPKLRNSNLPNLEFKLRELGLEPSDLVSIIHRRPRFLSDGVNRFFDGRLDHLKAFFGSRKVLIKAIVRNPSVLTYDFLKTVTPVVEMYAQLEIGKSDLIPLLLSRPTLIPRSKLCEDKLDYISRTAVSRESKMYKYMVVIIAISRVETIREKLAHFQKFGFSEDEILKVVGRTPLLLTLSTEKVQRNMTFVVGTIRLPAKDALDHPFLFFHNLDTLLKPRMHLACKIDEMELFPRIKGPDILRALRMTDDRFVKVFISCHPPDVREELECFRDAKVVKRLAVSSKKNTRKWFPF